MYHLKFITHDKTSEFSICCEAYRIKVYNPDDHTDENSEPQDHTDVEVQSGFGEAPQFFGIGDNRPYYTCHAYLNGEFVETIIHTTI